MSISSSDSANHGATAGTPASEAGELNRRLREQVAINAELDAEVHYLQQELAVRQEFVAHLEQQLTTAHVLDSHDRAVDAEFAAYRDRISHRTVDRLVASVHRLPWLYRSLRAVGRLATGRVAETDTPAGASTPGSPASP
jgi:hypothetical protein